MSEEAALAFFDEAATPYHVAAIAKRILLEYGYVELKETDKWPDPLPKHAFVVRDGLTIVAFTISNYDWISLTSCNTSVFGLKLKPEYEHCENGYYWVRASMSAASSPVWSTIHDCDLKIAGAVFVKHDGKFERRLIDSGRAIGTISTKKVPEKTMDRDKCYEVLIGKSPLKPYIATLAKCEQDEIVDWDLVFLPAAKTINSQKHFRGTFVAQYACPYALLHAFVNKKEEETGVKMLAIYGGDFVNPDYSRSGCSGDMLPVILGEIFKGKDYEKAKAHSLNVFVSPMEAQVGDDPYTAKLGSGVVIRTSVRSNIATEPIGEVLLAQVPCGHVQTGCDKNASISPRTKGSYIERKTGIRTAEVSICARELRHARECIAQNDLESLREYVQNFYDGSIPVKTTF